MSIQTNDTGLSTAISKFSLRVASLLGRGADRFREPTIIADPLTATKPPIVITEYGYSHGAVILNLAGQLNATSSEHLLTQAQATYMQGSRRLVLNLEQVSEIELSGIFALGNIARLYAGVPLIDPEGGWSALKQMAQDWPSNLPSQLVLVTSNTSVKTKLRQTHLHFHLPVYDDLVTAIQSFH